MNNISLFPEVEISGSLLKVDQPFDLGVQSLISSHRYVLPGLELPSLLPNYNLAGLHLL